MKKLYTLNTLATLLLLSLVLFCLFSCKDTAPAPEHPYRLQLQGTWVRSGLIHWSFFSSQYDPPLTHMTEEHSNINRYTFRGDSVEVQYWDNTTKAYPYGLATREGTHYITLPDGFGYARTEFAVVTEGDSMQWHADLRRVFNYTHQGQYRTSEKASVSMGWVKE